MMIIAVFNKILRALAQLTDQQKKRVEKALTSGNPAPMIEFNYYYPCFCASLIYKEKLLSTLFHRG